MSYVDDFLERNRRAFEDSERTIVELKLLLLKALYDWMAALLSHLFSSVLDFIDICSPF